MTVRIPLLPLAISLGDPAGVGPELIAAAWAQREAEGLPPFFAVGNRDLIEAAARSRGLAIPVVAIAAPDEAAAVFPHALPVLDVGTAPWAPGQPDDAGAALALRALEVATSLVKQGAAAALVTGPIAKSRLARIGFNQPGQTEFVAEACGITPENAVMMLAGPNLRVVPSPSMSRCAMCRSCSAPSSSAADPPSRRRRSPAISALPTPALPWPRSIPTPARMAAWATRMLRSSPPPSPR